MRPLAVVGLLVVALLAGCSSGQEDETVVPSERPDLAEGKGGILGLLIDDVYRTVPGGLVLLQGVGLTATSDARGQFTFTDLEPGTYIAIANAAGHEAPPVNIDVVAGEYAEAEILARRIFSVGGQIITTQYSVFVPCSASVVEATQTLDCTGDQTDDSFRAGFVANYTGYKDATYLITEMKSNHKASQSQGAFKVVVRELNACDVTCTGDYWASKFIVDGDYLKITMRVDNVSADDTEARNVAWKNDKQMETYLFPQGGFKTETQGLLDAGCASGAGAACFESRGLGPQLGVKANFVQSLFLGEPELDITQYRVLSEST